MSLFGELKRRNVFRVAIAYLAATWLLTEVADTLFPAFGLPEWGIKFIVVVFALGFVPALIFSWVYEITPEGVKREKDVVREASITRITAKRLDWITIAVIVAAVGFIALDRFWLDSRLLRHPVAGQDSRQATAQPAEEDRPFAEDDRPSIAVLPFANRSADPDDAFFVDGIHDDLLTYISKIDAVKTISRTSVLRYRDSNKSIPEIARELGVATILEGGVQRAGSQVRINVQLIDASTDEHLWAEIYDRRLSANNIFAIQSEIAVEIAEKLQAMLSPGEERQLRAVPTESFAAYEAYLIGKQLIAKRDSQSLADASVFLTEALDIDPSFAMAWVALADVYNLQWTYSGVPKEETLPKARAAIDKALALDPELGEAYASLGLLLYQTDDLEGAERSFREAIRLRRNYAPTYHWYSNLLTHDGRQEEALEKITTAIRLDPMSPVIRLNLARKLRSQGRHEEALEEFHKIIAINPEFPSAYDAIATMDYQVFNRMAQAAQTYTKVIELDPDRASAYVWLGQLYLELGAADRAERLFDRSRQLAPAGLGAYWGRLLTELYRDETENTENYARKLLEYFGPAHWIGQFSAAQLRNRALSRHDIAKAVEVYSTTYPDLFSESLSTVGLHNYRAAIDLALVLQQDGKEDEAARLLALSQDFIRGQPRLGWWGGFWVSDVQILALQGKRGEALEALREAADDGWRSLWWYYLRRDPNLDSIRTEPEFQQVSAEIDADMSAQMQQLLEMEKKGEISSVPRIDFGSH